MKEYVVTSLETHLFFARIMKEHALFLLASFPAGEMTCRNKADQFRQEFENVLEQTVMLSDGVVREKILCSGEIVTQFTDMAELQTEKLTKIPINVRITHAERKLRSGNSSCLDKRLVQRVKNLNRNVLNLLCGLIEFKEKVLQDVLSCDLYTSNYPLLIEHILREAKLYCQIIEALEEDSCMPLKNLKEAEMFWNQIMMEHALFIRGLLDPKECELMETADNFAGDYCLLLKEARKRDCQTLEEMTGKAMETTKKYRDFKAAGTKGIIGCDIRSVILPLLADHVLREANHYLRILEM